MEETFEREIEQIIIGIKNLEIQGARTIAKKAIEAIEIFAENYKKEDFEQKKQELINRLIKTRPTEPMMRNYLSRLRNKNREETIAEAKRSIEEMKENVKKIIEYGSRIVEGNIVMLCHSSTAVEIVKKASKKKNIKVVVGETRPRYQGRITYKELEKEGVDVTLVVDNALHRFVKKADLVLVGADAIDATGALYNKIGTYTLALLANKFDVPFYSSAETAKYDQNTRYGEKEIIEERDKKEVWEQEAKIINYAFDLIPAKYITAYITELGVIAPQTIATGGKYEWRI